MYLQQLEDVRKHVVMAIDPGIRNQGYVIGRWGPTVAQLDVVEAGLLTTGPENGATWERAKWIAEFMEERAIEHNVEIVAYETYFARSTREAQQSYIRGMLDGFTFDKLAGQLVINVNPQTLKKFLTGHGNANHRETYEALGQYVYPSAQGKLAACFNELGKAQREHVAMATAMFMWAGFLWTTLRSDDARWLDQHLDKSEAASVSKYLKDKTPYMHVINWTPPASKQVAVYDHVTAIMSYKALLQTVIDKCDRLIGLERCEEFAGSVRQQAEDVLAWVNEHDMITEDQMRAAQNWNHALNPWLGNEE